MFNRESDRNLDTLCGWKRSCARRVRFLGSHGITFADYDEDLALAASKLRPATRHKGLSLGDRACLALAIREGATAITTDRAWADLDVGCHIEVIR